MIGIVSVRLLRKMILGTATVCVVFSPGCIVRAGLAPGLLTFLSMGRSADAFCVCFGLRTSFSLCSLLKLIWCGPVYLLPLSLILLHVLSIFIFVHNERSFRLLPFGGCIFF